MTVYFHLEGVAFTVGGIKHANGFDVHSVLVQGNGADIKKLLSAPSLERIAEAAAEAAIDEIPFETPQPLSRMAVELVSDDDVEALR
jgi:hypothetical protein